MLAIQEFSVPQGQRVFLSGASGAGKSTLLGLIGGVLVPSRGTVRLLGTEVSKLPGAARDRFRGAHLGFIFQLFNLVPYLSVLDNVLLSMRFVASREARVGGDPETEARRLLGALGLADTLDRARRVTQLSIGQQQRVAAARALLGRPEIVIADEPTSALDHDARAAFLRLLMQECAAQGTTLLYVSHDHTLAGHFDRHVELAALNSALATDARA